MTSFMTLRSVRISIAALCALGLATLSGCGIGYVNQDASGTSTGLVHGTAMGGPNPISGANLYIYATGNTGYGTGATLINNTTTASDGSFTFPAQVTTCPTNSYAYMLAEGGTTGSNAVNYNNVLIAALGTCASVTASRNVLINELTTVVAAYTLGNFMTVTGTAPHFVGGVISGVSTGSNPAFTVNIGAPSTNAATAGCVNNNYYSGAATNPCTVPTATITAVTTAGAPAGAATVSAGLKHAFANADLLISSASATVTGTTTNNAVVPQPLIFSLGNTMQACVNSGGGGTSLGNATTPGTGLATSTTTTNDGTTCGKLFEYTDTTSAPTNTLSALMNLAKRPLGSGVLYDSACSVAGTANTAATCIYNLASSSSYYVPAMTAAPPDWTLGILYPSGSFGSAITSIACTNNASTGGPTTVNIATTGTVYPLYIATDVDDNLSVLNADSSAAVCVNVITFKYDGTPIGTSSYTNYAGNGSNAKVLATDGFGHAIVPQSAANTVFSYSAGAADTTIAAPVSTTVASSPSSAAADTAGNIYVTGVGGSDDFQKLTVASQGHTGETFTASDIDVVTGTAITSKFAQVSIAPNGNVFSETTSGSGTAGSYAYTPGQALAIKTSGTNLSSTINLAVAADSNGNEFVIGNDNTTAGQQDYRKYVFTTPITAAGTFSLANSQPGTTAIRLTQAVMDGNNVLWYADTSAGQSATYPATSGVLYGYDTVNNFVYLPLMGCQFETPTSTVCGNNNTAGLMGAGVVNKVPFDFINSRGIAIDAAGSLWSVNGASGTITEVFGLANPTLPGFVHNSTGLKP